MTEDTEQARRELVRSLDARIEHERTAAALCAVPRHAFVPPERRSAAYDDRPLSIGNGQTISAPHMVAIMTDRLALEPGERVLEIGTGCGYHAAVTAEVVGPEQVYSVEYDAELAEAARERLANLGYGDITVRVGDGRDGWLAHAPYDAAYLTCAAADFPPAVVDQTRVGGRLLAPLGTGRQTLVFARKTADALERSDHGGVRFVEMRG